MSSGGVEWISPSRAPFGARVGRTADGTRVLWVPRTGPTVARLTVRVGPVDETLVTRGSTRLVGHLAQNRPDARLHRTGSRVEPLFTRFDVRGTGRQVSDHLRALSGALADLPVEELDEDVLDRAMSTERRGPSRLDDLRRTRHGLRGWGLLSWQHGPVPPDPQSLHDWARRAFTASNAVLRVHGEEPPSSILSLPQGPPLPLPGLTTVPGRSPGWFTGPAGVVALSALGSQDPAVLAAWWWLRRALHQRLRRQDRSAHAVDASAQLLTPGHLEVGLFAHAAPGRENEVVLSIQDVVARLCAHELSVTDLEEFRRRCAPDRSRRPDVRGALDRLARQALLETDPRRAGAERTARIATLSPPEVREALVDLVRTVLLQVPPGTQGPVEMAPVTRSEPHVRPGRVFVGARHLEGGRRLVVAPEGIAVEPAPGARVAVAWARCTAVVRHPDGRRDIVGDDGVLTFDPAQWAQGHVALEAIDATCPADVEVAVTNAAPGSPTAVRQPPRVLSGLAGLSTGVLVFLVLTGLPFTLFMAGASSVSPNRGFAVTFSSVCLLLVVALVVALVQRLRFPRRERPTMNTRARTYAAVAADQFLARANRPLALGVAIGTWSVAIAGIVIGALHSIFFWPSVWLAVFAVRATAEVRRRG